MPPHHFDRSRRRFVLGTASAVALAALGAPPCARAAAPTPQNTLSGNRFDLAIAYRRVNFTGAEKFATVVNDSLPAPILRWREGEEVALRVSNQLAVDSSIHWHGIVLPASMDGVPGLSFAGIAPGESFEYRFKVRQHGTYWYHSHSNFQEQTGLYGAIIIDPAGADAFSADRDYVVVLSDWSDESPQTIAANLKRESDYYNLHRRTAGDLWREIRAQGVRETWNERAMWNRMRMSDRDIADVSGYTYTYLMNGHTPAADWTALFRRGERVRLRFINASAMTFFDVRIPGLKMKVISCDGQYIEPVSVDEFRLGVAETCDVLVEPAHDIAYTLFAQAMDRSGYARGTLTPDPALRAEVPALDAPPVLTHIDMGMSHDSTHVEHADHDAHQMHDMHGPHADHHDSAAHHHDSDNAADMHHAHGPARAGSEEYGEIVHPASERGPRVDMQAQSPRLRLDDPGPGLRNNGRRVLTYADLRNLVPTPDPRDPEREIQIHLTGNMQRFLWSIDGVPYAHAEPIALHYGERVRVVLVNDTMMSHPMHLHGMWSDLETGDGARLPRKHTVAVQPGAVLTHLVTADAPGSWAWHCHLLYHMAGMFREAYVS
ncbi:MAG: copper resistance system multicopper oxidase [Chromatiales bacterium]|nr:copper resistance system multicopper oxidase [Chromatiales bacterium]